VSGTHRFRSKDGLCTSADPDAIALWDRIGDRMESEQVSWSGLLREMGVKAEHPDDGWVRRNAEPQSVEFSYARFDLKPQVGDLIALGAPYHSGKFDDDPKGKRGTWRYRLVRVTHVHTRRGLIPGVEYTFEDTCIRLTETGVQPAVLPKPWWRLLCPSDRRTVPPAKDPEAGQLAVFLAAVVAIVGLWLLLIAAGLSLRGLT
jgi:hypothetical protein